MGVWSERKGGGGCDCVWRVDGWWRKFKCLDAMRTRHHVQVRHHRQIYPPKTPEFISARRPSQLRRDSNNGAKSNRKRPDRQADRGCRASLAVAARRACAGQQRCEEHGFLQGATPPPHSCMPTSIAHGGTGIQCPHGALHPRHPNTRTHNRPPRPLLQLLVAHAAHRHAAAQRCRRAAH
jgi:hypothetical protein